MIQADTLKPGWQIWRFDQIATNVNDRIKDPREADVNYYVGLEHLDSDSLKIRRWGSPSDVEATKLRFRKGDIILGRRRVYQRKVAVTDFDGICSAHALVLRAKPDVILPGFLPFFMQSEVFMERAKAISVGSLSPTINWKTLAKEKFALPSIDEQRKISKLLNAVETTNNDLKVARDYAEKLRKSLLKNIFNALESSGLIQLPLLGITTVCNRIKVEQAGSVLMGRQLSPKYKTGLFSRPYLRVANVFDSYIDTTEVYEMDFSDIEFDAYKLRNGDILLNEGQSRELVGRSAIYSNDVENCCFQNTLIRFRTVETVMPEYAHYYFQYCQYTGRFVQIAKQTTSIAHLGVQRFAAMKFPLIARDIQKEIVKILSNTIETISKLDERIESSKYIKKYTLNEILKT